MLNLEDFTVQTIRDHLLSDTNPTSWTDKTLVKTVARRLLILLSTMPIREVEKILNRYKSKSI
jgi:hypothetical protein